MAAGRQLGKSDLFLVRLWTEETEEGETAWCGKVQQAVTGEARFFHELPELINVLLSMVPAARATAYNPLSGETSETPAPGPPGTAEGHTNP